MKDLYICFSNVDRLRVIPIVEALEREGFSCCIFGRDFDFFPSWEENMTNAVYCSTMALFFDSAAARKSSRIPKELKEIEECGLLRADFSAETACAAEVLPVVRDRFPEAVRIRETAMRPVPYDGEDPYIFVSYAHRNMEKVLPIVRLLQENGYRVWYDEGIDPGTEWANNIADHLEGARQLFACLSREYLESTNCRDELFFAGTLDMDILLLYLEEIRLEKGMAMKAGHCPEIRSDLLKDREGFLKRLETLPAAEECRE